tara:strand:+ start:231 stop:416 length:186 start_codon:yes stop_codon:yes gene_type:complete
MGIWKSGVSDTLFPSDPRFWVEKRREEQKIKEEKKEVINNLYSKEIQEEEKKPNTLEPYLK